MQQGPRLAAPGPALPAPALLSTLAQSSSLALAGMRLGILIDASPAWRAGWLSMQLLPGCNVPAPQVSWTRTLPGDQKDQV